MIRVAAAVVTHRAADVFRDGREVSDEGFDGFGFKRGVAGHGLVHVVHVCLVMSAVMNFHGQRVDVRLKRFFRVRKWW